MKTTVLAASVLFLGSSAEAQEQADPGAFAITDNSFFVEEAFNQEPGIVQHIVTFANVDQEQISFAQEWPVRGVTHQFSYGLSFNTSEAARALEGFIINYRYQLSPETSSRPAVSPRISVVYHNRPDLPWGLEANLPVSKRFGRVYVHGNVGADLEQTRTGTRTSSDYSARVGASAMYKLAEMLNPMLEVVRSDTWLVSPGIRGGWNVGKNQIVVGAAAPVTFTDDGRSTTGVFLYFSFEGPLKF